MILQVDLDRDGTLSYSEFAAIQVHLRSMTNDEHLHKAFSLSNLFNASGWAH